MDDRNIDPFPPEAYVPPVPEVMGGDRPLIAGQYETVDAAARALNTTVRHVIATEMLTQLKPGGALALSPGDALIAEMREVMASGPQRREGGPVTEDEVIKARGVSAVLADMCAVLDGKLRSDAVIGDAAIGTMTVGSIRAASLSHPVLMSRENPYGWTLEGLADKLIGEMEAKTANIANDKREHAQALVWRNRAILGHLGEIRRIQRENVAHLAAYAPDPGPTGTPRVGVGSEGYVPAETIHHPV